MEPEELESLAEFATQRQREQAWGNQAELLAMQTELLHGILARLTAGVQTVMVKRLGDPGKPFEVERPDWVQRVRRAVDERVVSPREFFAMMRGR